MCRGPSGEGFVAASVSFFPPSLAGDPEPSDDGILLAREKDLTSSLSELEQFQVIFYFFFFFVQVLILIHFNMLFFPLVSIFVID